MVEGIMEALGYVVANLPFFYQTTTGNFGGADTTV